MRKEQVSRRLVTAQALAARAPRSEVWEVAERNSMRNEDLEHACLQAYERWVAAAAVARGADRGCAASSAALGIAVDAASAALAARDAFEPVPIKAARALADAVGRLAAAEQRARRPSGAKRARRRRRGFQDDVSSMPQISSKTVSLSSGGVFVSRSSASQAPLADARVVDAEAARAAIPKPGRTLRAAEAAVAEAEAEAVPAAAPKSFALRSQPSPPPRNYPRRGCGVAATPPPRKTPAE